MSIKVLKFGGTSVGSTENIKMIGAILTKRHSQDERLTVVCSAFNKVTDGLLEMSRKAALGDESYLEDLLAFSDRHKDAALQLLPEKEAIAVLTDLKENHEVLSNLLRGIFLVREASARTMDYVLSFGERNSCFIIAAYLRSIGLPAYYADARQFIKTNKEFGAAKVNFEETQAKVDSHFKARQGEIPVVTGFIATDLGGLTTTLGRGGSDYTAAILASTLGASVLEIWTDVDGVLTADPRKVKSAFTLPHITYTEAMEMSHFGAKVIYPPTIIPALKKNIPIYIKNTFNPEFEGTLIDQQGSTNSTLPIKGVTALGDIALIKIQGTGLVGVPGASARIFAALGLAKVNVVLISQASSEHSICIAISAKDAKNATRQLEQEFSRELEVSLIDQIGIEHNVSIIAVVGGGMKNSPGIAGSLFQALGKNGINIIAIAQGSSELNISLVISKRDELKALNVIHEAFFLSDIRKIHLFIMGVGLIGSELLDQIRTQVDQLVSQYRLSIQVVGIANSKKMAFAPNGHSLSEWRQTLEESDLASEPRAFITQMAQLNLPNSIFIDNTANKDIPQWYEEILNASISIATPNKVATSSSYAQYKKLKDMARQKGISFKYETNVGAGLPILSTIQNLKNSGDQVTKIEAIVSGSLSYIFNKFNSQTLFSQLVLEARSLGYTEPDPREDLSGADVTRKLVILAREAGYPLEFDQVQNTPILPKELMDAPDTDSFLKALPSADVLMTSIIQSAEQEGKVLRLIAMTQGTEASIKLTAVDKNHPFFSLEGSDNMFVIYTNRYHSRPLIIRGPGAGAQVTAAGVFADVLSMAMIS